VLQPGEAIFYVARMNRPVNLAEQLTAGWLLQRAIVVVMVFTNERLICLPVTYEGRWKGSLRVISYGDLAKTKVSGFLSKVLELHYGIGKRDRFWGLKRRDASKIAALLRVLQPQSAATPISTGMVSLCPECLAPLTPAHYQCTSCGLVFKDEATMRKRALLIPGGGYFYCDAVGMGVLAALAELYLISETLLLVLALFAAFTAPATQQTEGIAGLAAVLVFFVLLLAFEKLVQMNHCRRFIREFISTGEKKPVMPMTAGATRV
jgi:hypothetical protein